MHTFSSALLTSHKEGCGGQQTRLALRMPRSLSPAPIRHGEGAPCPVRRKERLRSQREGAVPERRLHALSDKAMHA